MCPSHLKCYSWRSLKSTVVLKKLGAGVDTVCTNIGYALSLLSKLIGYPLSCHVIIELIHGHETDECISSFSR